MMLHVVMSEYLESVQKLNTVSRKSHHRFPADRWYVCSESLSPGYVDRVERQLPAAYPTSALVWWSLLDLAPAYLRDLYCTTLSVLSRRSPRSTVRARFAYCPF